MNCHYLIGKNTLDSKLFKMLERKKEVVSTILDGEQTKLKIENNIEHAHNNSSKITSYFTRPGNSRSLMDVEEEKKQGARDQNLSLQAGSDGYTNLFSEVAEDTGFSRQMQPSADSNNTKDELIDEIEQILQDI